METLLGLLLSLFFGFIPMFFFASILYWLDRYEKEPKILLLGVFTWGALFAAGIAFVVNTLFGLSIFIFTGSEFATELTTGSISAPLVEESLKGLAVLGVFLLFRKEFDSLLDGIVYAGVAALGFAATENAYYIFTYGFLEEGFSGLLWLVIVRVVMVGWQHPFYSAFIGIGLAISRLNRGLLISIAAPVAGWVVAVLAHSMHNTLATLLTGLEGLTVTLLFDWTGWLFMFLFILYAIAREQKYLADHLREEVALGVISQQHYQTACSSWKQSAARLASLFEGKYNKTRRFYQIAGQLAHKKHHLTTLGEEEGNTSAIKQLRSELMHLAPAARY
jgi:protease PrsW